MGTHEEIMQNLPLTEATFMILLSLSTDSKHGYAIMQDVESLSEGRVAFSTGTLYGALSRLLDQGWIERVEEEQASGRTRKSYKLGELGRRILNAEMERLAGLVSVARLRLSEGGA